MGGATRRIATACHNWKLSEGHGMTDIRILAKGLGFPEGPVAMADGSIILTEINGGQVTRVSVDGIVTRLGQPGGGPNGLARAPDGGLILCNNGGSRYLPGQLHGPGTVRRLRIRLGRASRSRDRRCAGCCTKAANGHKLSAPNDLVFDRHGGFYFTDLGKR